MLRFKKFYHSESGYLTRYIVATVLLMPALVSFLFLGEIGWEGFLIAISVIAIALILSFRLMLIGISTFLMVMIITT